MDKLKRLEEITNHLKKYKEDPNYQMDWWIEGDEDILLELIDNYLLSRLRRFWRRILKRDDLKA